MTRSRSSDGRSANEAIGELYVLLLGLGEQGAVSLLDDLPQVDLLLLDGESSELDLVVIDEVVEDHHGSLGVLVELLDDLQTLCDIALRGTPPSSRGFGVLGRRDSGSIDGWSWLRHTLQNFLAKHLQPQHDRVQRRPNLMADEANKDPFRVQECDIFGCFAFRKEIKENEDDGNDQDDEQTSGAGDDREGGVMMIIKNRYAA